MNTPLHKTILNNLPEKNKEYLTDLYKKNKFEKIITLLPSLLKNHSNSLFLYNIQGAAYLNLKKYKLSFDSFKKVISIDPNLESAYINLGFISKENNKYEDALRYFEYSIKINPHNPLPFFHMGLLSQNKGNFTDAIQNYKKAVKLNPNFFESYCNLGNSFRAIGNYKESIDNYNHALKLNKDNPYVHYNLGVVLFDNNELHAAIKSYKNAITINPNYFEAYCNLGNCYQKTGNLFLAIDSYLKSFKINPNYDLNYINIGLCLRDISLLQPIQGIEKILIKILKFKKYVPAKYIVRAVISVIKFDKSFYNLINDNDLEKYNVNFVLEKITKNFLLVELMKSCTIPDPKIENFLLKVRFIILKNLLKLENNDQALEFTRALATQCFLNEYIYVENSVETQLILNVEKSIKQTFDMGMTPNLLLVSILASYRQLSELEQCNYFEKIPHIPDLVEKHIIEVKKEEMIKKTISKSSGIIDSVSIKVKNQYEENPYPRWDNLYLNTTEKSIQQLMKESRIKVPNKSIFFCKKPNILIAGCGTGEHSIRTALRFKDCKILAIDLSLSSLAFAIRKSKELNITNIEYLQSDLLDITKLKMKFDIIECCGVLHHMKRPLLGWKSLCNSLKPNGLLKIALYSKKARQNVKKIQEEKI